MRGLTNARAARSDSYGGSSHVRGNFCAFEEGNGGNGGNGGAGTKRELGRGGGSRRTCCSNVVETRPGSRSTSRKKIATKKNPIWPAKEMRIVMSENYFFSLFNDMLMHASLIWETSQKGNYLFFFPICI